MAETDDSEEVTGNTGRSGAALVWGVIAAPLLYILSVGPVAAIWQKTHWSTTPLEAFYAPLIWLHENTPLEKPLDVYVDLWGVK